MINDSINSIDSTNSRESTNPMISTNSMNSMNSMNSATDLYDYQYIIYCQKNNLRYDLSKINKLYTMCLHDEIKNYIDYYPVKFISYKKIYDDISKLLTKETTFNVYLRKCFVFYQIIKQLTKHLYSNSEIESAYIKLKILFGENEIILNIFWQTVLSYQVLDKDFINKFKDSIQSELKYWEFVFIKYPFYWHNIFIEKCPAVGQYSRLNFYIGLFRKKLSLRKLKYFDII